MAAKGLLCFLLLCCAVAVPNRRPHGARMRFREQGLRGAKRPSEQGPVPIMDALPPDPPGFVETQPAWNGPNAASHRPAHPRGETVNGYSLLQSASGKGNTAAAAVAAAAATPRHAGEHPRSAARGQHGLAQLRDQTLKADKSPPPPFPFRGEAQQQPVYPAQPQQPTQDQVQYQQQYQQQQQQYYQQQPQDQAYAQQQQAYLQQQPQQAQQPYYGETPAYPEQQPQQYALPSQDALQQQSQQLPQDGSYLQQDTQQQAGPFIPNFPVPDPPNPYAAAMTPASPHNMFQGGNPVPNQQLDPYQQQEVNLYGSTNPYEGDPAAGPGSNPPPAQPQAMLMNRATPAQVYDAEEEQRQAMLVQQQKQEQMQPGMVANRAPFRPQPAFLQQQQQAPASMPASALPQAPPAAFLQQPATVMTPPQQAPLPLTSQSYLQATEQAQQEQMKPTGPAEPPSLSQLEASLSEPSLGSPGSRPPPSMPQLMTEEPDDPAFLAEISRPSFAPPPQGGMPGAGSFVEAQSQAAPSNAGLKDFQGYYDHANQFPSSVQLPAERDPNAVTLRDMKFSQKRRAQGPPEPVLPDVPEPPAPLIF